jgi:hypothetical protein
VTVECGVVLFRSLFNYIEREPNRRESCHPHQRRSAELDRKEVGDDLLFLGVPVLDDVTFGKSCSMQSLSSSSLTGVEFTEWVGRSSFRRRGGCGLPFGGYLS